MASITSWTGKTWIFAEKPDPEISIIDENMWNRVQDTRKQRADKYIKTLENHECHCNKKKQWYACSD